jgi:tetratricopeptide (TPR) repeat protein
MNAERWQRVEDLFHQAADLSPAQRAAFLDEACAGDEDLRRDVDALLAHDATQGDITHDVAMQAAVGRAVEQLPDTESDTTAPLLWMPATIGRYRILRLVAEGGMGIVYEAEQEQPRRIVALKVIKPSQASPGLLRRFEQESQALARLQHPGIAQIYEAGTADTGFGPQPFFAMEFIRGQSLLAYAEAHGLDTRQRLELMVKICDAVHHAHQRGLIHRDLKPGNILVDDTGQPKILDFGIARATDSDAQAATQQTDVGQLVGTLAYMSPEQVLGEPLEIDTRSDVYALGVVLFELLAGKLPYKISGQLHQAVQTIREADPAPLSSISRVYRGDIETIVAKALEKDKSHRYGSAAGLADDIRRYLNDEPIIARPPSATYQLQKFARRHKALVAGMAAVFVALIAGIIASTWEATRARRAEQTATAVDDFLRNDLLAQASANVQARPDTNPDANLKVRTVLDRAAARLDGKFPRQPLLEASIRETIGKAYEDLGLYPQSQRQLEQALQLERRQNQPLPATTGDLARIYFREAKYAQSEALLTKLLDALPRRRGGKDIERLSAMNVLAAVYRAQAKYGQAEPLYLKVVELRRQLLGEEHPDTLSAMNNLATFYVSQGKYAQAEPLHVKVLEAYRRVLGEEHPETLISLHNLGVAYRLEGKYAQAEEQFIKELEINRRVLGERHPETLGSIASVALLYQAAGKYPQAEAMMVKVLDIRRNVLGNEHPDSLASMSSLGEIYRMEGKYSLAESLFTALVTLRARVRGTWHPDTLTAKNRLAVVYRDESKYSASEPLLNEVLAARRKSLGEDHPDTLTTMNNLAELYLDRQQYTQAEPLLKKALEGRRRRLGADHPDTIAVMNNLAKAYLGQTEYPECEKLLTAVPDPQDGAQETWRRYQTQSLLGAALAGQKQYAKAEPLAVSGYQRMFERQTALPYDERSEIARAGARVIQLYKDWGKKAKAAEWKRQVGARRRAYRDGSF